MHVAVACVDFKTISYYKRHVLYVAFDVRFIHDGRDVFLFYQNYQHHIYSPVLGKQTAAGILVTNRVRYRP